MLVFWCIAVPLLAMLGYVDHDLVQVPLWVAFAAFIFLPMMMA